MSEGISYGLLSEKQRKDQDYSDALFALVNRLGGSVRIEAHELPPTGRCTIARRRGRDGTLEMMVKPGIEQ